MAYYRNFDGRGQMDFANTEFSACLSEMRNTQTASGTASSLSDAGERDETEELSKATRKPSTPEGSVHGEEASPKSGIVPPKKRSLFGRFVRRRGKGKDSKGPNGE